jgi:hypothetical protein
VFGVAGLRLPANLGQMQFHLGQQLGQPVEGVLAFRPYLA